MATSALNMLTRAQLTSAVSQILSNIHFTEVNSHIPPQDRNILRTRIMNGEWPDYPIFSPYAKTHDQYSQIKFQGIKHLVHRLTFRHFHGRQLSEDKEISHTLNCGTRSSSNINPRYMIEEAGILNRSRITCFMYLDFEMRKLLAIRNRTERDEQVAVATAYALMAECRACHREVGCTLDLKAWLHDHAAPNMGEEYARQTESEAEAVERLGSDDDGSGSDTTREPQSSQLY